MFGTGAILEGAFRLVRERPGAVAIWGLIYFLCIAAMLASLRPFAQLLSNPAAARDPAAVMGVIGGVFLVELLLMVVLVVLFAAAFRAVLRPERSGFGYLRLGMDELRLLGLGLLVGVLSFIAYLVALIVIGVVAGVLTNAVGVSAGFLTSALLVLAWIAGFFYVQVRLSLAGPLSVYRGRFVLGEAWALTRGRFWAIFLAYALIVVILSIAQMIVSAVAFMPMYSAMIGEAMRHPQDPAASQAASAQMMGQMTSFGPTMIGLAVFGAVIAALWVALNGGAAATAAKLLAGGREAEAFE